MLNISIDSEKQKQQQILKSLAKQSIKERLLIDPY